jgi:hypothetical protein
MARRCLLVEGIELGPDDAVEEEDRIGASGIHSKAKTFVNSWKREVELEWLERTK